MPFQAGSQKYELSFQGEFLSLVVWSVHSGTEHPRVDGAYPGHAQGPGSFLAGGTVSASGVTAGGLGPVPSRLSVQPPEEPPDSLPELRGLDRHL